MPFQEAALPLVTLDHFIIGYRANDLFICSRTEQNVTVAENAAPD